MISRRWTAPVPKNLRQVYTDYIMGTGFVEYASTPGNRGAFLLIRDEGERSYFTALTFWDNVEAIKAFAGEDYRAAKYYPKDDEFLLEKPDTVEHEEMVFGQAEATSF